MRQLSLVLCILGAMIGAGFASGREIMAFFTGYGPFSWALVLLAGMGMTAVIYRIMQKSRGDLSGLFPRGRGGGIARGLMFLLLSAAGGGMTAAAGELTALVLPIHHAEALGMGTGLLGCLLLSHWSMNALSSMGRILLPLLLIAFLLCIRLPHEAQPLPPPTAWEMILGVIGAAGYAGFNGMLSAGVLCQAGAACKKRGKCRLAAWSGGAIMGMLLLGNGALIPKGTVLAGEALPMVVLLRAYGKAGYYLSAGVLYLGIITTLIAVLQGMRSMLMGWCSFPNGAAFCICALAALMGFEKIVSSVYLALGLLCLLFLFLPQKKERLIQPPAHTP